MAPGRAACSERPPPAAPARGRGRGFGIRDPSSGIRDPGSSPASRAAAAPAGNDCYPGSRQQSCVPGISLSSSSRLREESEGAARFVGFLYVLLSSGFFPPTGQVMVNVVGCSRGKLFVAKGTQWLARNCSVASLSLVGPVP